MEGDEGCTAAGRARFSCFAADALVNQLGFGGNVQPTPVKHVAVGDQVCYPLVSSPIDLLSIDLLPNRSPLHERINVPTRYLCV